MKPSFELFDHTADIGFRVRAATPAELLEPAGRALYTVIGELFPGGEPSPIRLEMTGAQRPYLLRDYLAELLNLFERRRRMVTSVTAAEFTDARLGATVQTAALDLERSAYHREVKAITYHELDIRTVPGGHQATVIVDI